MISFLGSLLFLLFRSSVYFVIGNGALLYHQQFHMFILSRRMRLCVEDGAQYNHVQVPIFRTDYAYMF